MKAQPLENVHHHRTEMLQQSRPFLENYSIVQHTDVTLNMDKTEPFTLDIQNSNYAELIKSIPFSLPAMDDFIPKSPDIHNYFYQEQTENT